MQSAIKCVGSRGRRSPVCARHSACTLCVRIRHHNCFRIMRGYPRRSAYYLLRKYKLHIVLHCVFRFTYLRTAPDSSSSYRLIPVASQVPGWVCPFCRNPAVVALICCLHSNPVILLQFVWTRNSDAKRVTGSNWV